MAISSPLSGDRVPSAALRALGGVPPPPVGPGVCARCHGPSVQGPECWCCRQVGRLLGEPPGAGPIVVPVALCRPGDALHGALRRYKDAPALSARHHYAGVLAWRLHDFLLHHRRCLELAAGTWDALTLVPSTSRAPLGAPSCCPLGAVAGKVPELQGLTELALDRGPGRAGHLHPAPDGFRVAAADTLRRRVLLLDDTWVTGARARSAAAALAGVEATVVAIVVVGRTVEPGAAPRLARWWDRHGSPSSDARCCLRGCRQGTGSVPPARRLWSNAAQSG